MCVCSCAVRECAHFRILKVQEETSNLSFSNQNVKCSIFVLVLVMFRSDQEAKVRLVMYS